MATSTFGSSFAQSFQQSVAAARRAAEEEAAEKRYDKRVAEQHAYGAMQETKRELKESKKELYRLGGTEEEAETYNEDNMYAIGLRIAELRDQYNAGRTGQLSGEGSGQPVDSLLGKIGIDTSLGYQKGVQVAKSEQLEQKFKDRLEREKASDIRGDLRQDSEQTRLDRAVAFGASHFDIPLNFDQPIDNIELDQKAVEAMKAHNIARMQAGLEPMPLSERLFTSGMQPEGTGTARRPMEPTLTKPTQGSYSQIFNAEQLRNAANVKAQATASAGGRIDAENNQAANRALSDKKLPEEYRALFDERDFKSKYGALMNQYYQNQAAGEAGRIRNEIDLDALRKKQAYTDSYEIIKGAEALGIVAGVDDKGLVTEDFKKKFLSEFEKKKTVSRSQDRDTGEDTSTTVTNWVRRGTNKPAKGNVNYGDPIKIGDGIVRQILPGQKTD
jgi:hypothetical protein